MAVPGAVTVSGPVVVPYRGGMRIVGVYRADGGLVGELRYLVGHYLHGQSCTLCDITHSPLRRKRAWDEAAAKLGIPIDLRHLNELTPAQAAFVGDRAACVFSEVGDERTMLLTNEQLAAVHGDVPQFFAALRQALSD